MFKIFEKVRIRDRMREYPCEDYLHNALRFMAEGKPDIAYEEVCHALLRCGVELRPEESKIFNVLRNRKGVTKSNFRYEAEK